MNRGPETVNHKAKLVETRSVGADFQCNVDGEVGDGAGAVAVAYGPTARRGAEPSSLILGTLWVVSPLMGHQPPAGARCCSYLVCSSC